MANEWLRLWHDMPNDPKWRTVSRISGQPVSLVMAVYLHLLVDASRNVTRGHVDVTAEDIASALDVTEREIEDVLSAMQGRVLDGDYLSGWEKRQPRKEDAGSPETGAKSAAERKRAQREREKMALESSDVTTSHDESRNVTTDKDKDKDKELNTPYIPQNETDEKEPLAKLADGFDEFWEIQGKKGSRLKAEKAWGRLSAKVRSEIMADLAKRTRSPEWLKDSGKYRPHASTYLNQKRWLDECAPLAFDPQEAIAAYNTIVAQHSQEVTELTPYRVNLICDLVQSRPRMAEIAAWTAFFDGAVEQFKQQNRDGFRQKLRFDALVRAERAQECINGTLFRFREIA